MDSSYFDVKIKLKNCKNDVLYRGVTKKELDTIFAVIIAINKEYQTSNDNDSIVEFIKVFQKGGKNENLGIFKN